MYTAVIQTTMNAIHAENFILPTTAPEISAAVKPANVSWNATNNNEGIDPFTESILIPLINRLAGYPISSLIVSPNANW